MSFSEFKDIPQVQRKYDIKYKEQNFIEINEFVVPESFRKEFEFNLENLDAFSSEGARCGKKKGTDLFFRQFACSSSFSVFDSASDNGVYFIDKTALSSQCAIKSDPHREHSFEVMVWAEFSKK